MQVSPREAVITPKSAETSPPGNTHTHSHTHTHTHTHTHSHTHTTTTTHTHTHTHTQTQTEAPDSCAKCGLKALQKAPEDIGRSVTFQDVVKMLWCVSQLAI